MSDLNNIDKLLKDNFVDFTPDAPDVWQGIQQGVQAVQVGQAATTAAVVKSTSLAVKIMATVAISASVVVGYVLLNKDETASPRETIVSKAQAEATAPATTADPQEAVVMSQDVPPMNEPEERHTAATKDAAPMHRLPAKAVMAEIQTPESDFKVQSLQEVKTVEKVLLTNIQPQFAKENKVEESPEDVQPKTDLQAVAPPTNEREEYGEVIIPNTFTPNGDGKNDRFVILIENEQFYSLTIMDRNGKEVFESNDKNIQWDGKDYKSGVPCPAGTYYRVFRYQLKGAQSESKTTGIIILIN